MGGHRENVEYLRSKFPHIKTLRWTDHLSTISRAVPQSRTEYCWVVSSCVDYREFDFLWVPPPWQQHQVHCWPSGDQQFGDTFLIPINQWKTQCANLQKLEDYRDVNFDHPSLPRLSWEKIRYQDLTLPEILSASECHTPYVYFCNDEDCIEQHDAWLWREQPVVSLSTDNGCSLVPRQAHGAIRSQIYDYAWLIKSEIPHVAKPLDIVFISNGEHGADHHWEVLKHVVSQPRIFPNRLHRVDGVNGRVAAYQAAAQASETDWFFAVFAKLQVNTDFDWSWQPDRWQPAKHYIFQAYNPVNGLAYGHQAMIAYNRRLVMENTGQGLDFTLDQPHEVVPIISGTAYYDNDPWTCWRTAFREALKLRHSLPDVENEYRLDRWLTVGNGVNGHWSTQGAQDAMEYYDEVGGGFAAIKKSYEWQWLASYAMVLHPELFTQSKT